MHVTSNPLDWYAARAAGIAAYVLISFVVVLGLTMARNARLRRWPKYALEDVHRFAGLLVGTFLVIHVVTIAIDAWLPFSFASIVLPFVSRYRPVWVAFGIVAAELLLALAITNHYRDRLPYRFWRRTHYLNFAVWALATVHGIGERYRSQRTVVPGAVRPFDRGRWRGDRLAVRAKPTVGWAFGTWGCSRRCGSCHAGRCARRGPVPLPQEALERRQLQRATHRAHLGSDRRHARDRLDGWRGHRHAAGARTRRPAGTAGAHRAHGLSDGVLAERHALHRHRHESRILRL